MFDFLLSMFKGILPSKRATSSDFTMVTPLLDTNGKENLSDVAAPQKNTRSALAANKVQMQVQEKKKREEVKKGKYNKDHDLEGPGTNQAFDRLLVSNHYLAYRRLVYSITFRMICRYPTLCGLNLPEWMLL